MVHRPVTQSEFSNLYQFGPSHMQWSARNALLAHEAEGLGDSPSARALRSFVTHVKDHIQIRKEVMTSDGDRANPLLIAADRKVDLTYVRFVDRVRAEPALFGAESLRGQAAQRLLDGPLSLPVHAVVNADRVEEEALLKTIIVDIDTNHLADIDTLELATHYQLLKDDTDEFVSQMSVDARRRRLPSRTELEEERKHLQALMLGCIHRIMGAYPDPTPEDLAMRSILLGPFAIQNDRIGAYHRRRRGRGNHLPPEADVDTGEFLDHTDDVLEPSADTPEPVEA